MKFLKVLLLLIGLFFTVYFIGPAPSAPAYAETLEKIPSDFDSLENYIRLQESMHKIKPDNEARIVWNNDSSHQKTEYAIVYLHGFSASQQEGFPVHRDIAKKFGCNLYLSRLSDHGIDTTDPMLNFTVDNYWNSAKEALSIGSKLGNKVILMGCSTGGTLALMLAASYPQLVDGLVLLSPNIAINEQNAFILNNHWGLQMARWVKGGNSVYSTDQRPEYKKYWYSNYRLEAAVQLQELLETKMNKATFESVKAPVLLLYYFKDQSHQDPVVKVSAMLSMFVELGSEIKEKQALPETGDHVIASYLKSNDIGGVEHSIADFLQNKMGLVPAH